MEKELAIKIIQLDAQIAQLQSGKWQAVSGDIEKEIENLKKQKIQLYENSCNRF